MAARNADPYFTTARFPSVCPQTGKPIAKGDRIAYYPSARKAYHDDSPQASELRGMNISTAFGLADATW